MILPRAFGTNEQTVTSGSECNRWNMRCTPPHDLRVAIRFEPRAQNDHHRDGDRRPGGEQGTGRAEHGAAQITQSQERRRHGLDRIGQDGADRPDVEGALAQARHESGGDRRGRHRRGRLHHLHGGWHTGAQREHRKGVPPRRAPDRARARGLDSRRLRRPIHRERRQPCLPSGLPARAPTTGWSSSPSPRATT